MKKRKAEKDSNMENVDLKIEDTAQQSAEEPTEFEDYKQSALIAAKQMMEALRQSETLSKALEEAGQKTEQYQNQLIRQKAEFDNYRKRTTAELAAARDEGIMEALRLILPSLDNLNRALQTVRQEGSESVAQGIEMVSSGLLASFEKKGLQMMDAMGKTFDPNFHAAAGQEPCKDEDKKNTVAEVLQNGYLYKGQVLRYATVKVFV